MQPPPREPQRLGIGTVQFGTDYGVSNTLGRPPRDEVRIILEQAALAGMRWLDTAAGYGESEAVLGDVLPADTSFRIVTKTLPCPGAGLSDEDLAMIASRFHASLANLRRPAVDAVLVHHADTLLGPGGERLWERMLGWRQAGLASRLGASVYTPAQLESLLERFPLTLVQLPLNVFDQRFVTTGWLAELSRRGIAVHSRSAFLQGLLLMAPEALPNYFTPLRSHLQHFQESAQLLGASPLAAALAFSLSQASLETVLVGVASAPQLREVLHASHQPLDLPWETYALADEQWINPSKWRIDK